jgi:pyrimidine-specific ribonucleoside hydrolase
MNKKMPIIHVTDLYHPAQDPDDHFDLATLFALPEVEIKAVLLDATQRFIDGIPNEDYPRDPGYASVNQLSYLTGISFPVAVGPMQLLKSVDDDISDRPPKEQAAVNLLLKILSESDQKVIITCVGSVRIISAAYNRNSDLMFSKVESIYLNGYY